MALKRKLLVKGKIIFKIRLVTLSSATVYIKLEDTELADRPAKTIEQVQIRNIQNIFIEKGYIPFTIYGTIPDKQLMYSVSTLVDLDGDGKVSKGDYINMENYPVSSINPPTYLTVRVFLVK